MKAFLFAVLVLPAVLGAPQGGNIFLDNLTPQEAQRFLTDEPTDNLSYARKLGEEQLSPTGRSADGRTYYHNGRKIEDPQNYVESTFLAHQFHGQDGLGKAKFGYKDWNQAHKQHIHGDGTVKGSYQFTYPNGRVYKVNYFADSQGFHQEDNRPKQEIEPVTDTPAVKAAKEAHFKKWNEIAAANKAAAANAGPYHADYEQYKDVTGPPHGFYYQFDYPVHLIEPVNARARFNSEELETVDPTPESRIDGIHDAQVHPKQKTDEVKSV